MSHLSTILLHRCALALGCAVLTGSLAGCGSAPTATIDAPDYVVSGNSITIPAGSPLRHSLTIAPATALSLGDGLSAPATVEVDPARQTRLLTPLAGRVLSVAVRPGDDVRAGQVLAVLSSPDLSAALADDRKARAALAQARTVRDRATGLKAIGGAAEKDVEQAQLDFATAQAEASRTADRLHQTGASGGTIVLRATSSGQVTDLTAAPGAFWTDVTAPLMSIADTRSVWITANVPESALGSVHPGQPVRIGFTAFPGTSVPGHVQSIAALLDADTRRAKVRIALPNPDGRFRPGMFATVTFAAPRIDKPSLPTSALILKDDATIVYAQVRPWVFEARPVETGAEQGDRTVIEHGVTIGQSVIVRGGVLIDD